MRNIEIYDVDDGITSFGISELARISLLKYIENTSIKQRKELGLTEEEALIITEIGWGLKT